MIICIDFDGTIVRHEFPKIGEEVEGAFHWMRVLQDAGARLILWTMRDDGKKLRNGEVPHDILSHAGKPYMTDAVEFCRTRGVEFWGVNQNPEQHTWSASPKAYANLYVDDAAFGCPLIFPETGRPYADWNVIGPAILDAIMLEEGKR